MMRSRRTVGGLPVRSLQTLGVNFGYVEIPADPSEPEAVRQLIEGLVRSGGVEIHLFKGAPAGGASEERLRAALKAAGCRWIAHEHREAVLDASGGPAGYEAGRSRKLWRNIRSRRRRLEEHGAVRVDRHRSLSREAAVWEEIFSVSLRSWKGEAKSAVGLKPEYGAFLKSLAARFGERGEAEVWILRLQDEAIAYRVGCRSDASFLECEIAYDQAWATYSPGTLLAAASNETLVSEGVTEIDLGIAFGWKDEWSPVHRAWSEIVAFAPGNPYAALAYHWARARRRAPDTVPAEAAT
jgi:CelD/BcsL family acetyltransferase involved in cellulose biosynthesis